MPEKPQQNPEVKSQNNKQELTKENLNSMLCEIKKGNVSKEKMEHIVDYVLKLAQIESKYSGQKDKIKKDVRFFIENSVKNTLNPHLAEYNISKFDVDGQAGFDKAEEENYSRAIGESIGQIILFGGIEKFSKIHSESNGPGGFTGAYKYIANSLDMGRFFGNTKDKHFMESLIQKYGMISEIQLKEMQEKPFDITSKESRGDLAILLFKEFGDGTQDVLRFLGNIPSGLILIPLYTKYRIQANSNDPQTKAEAEIKLKELIEQNPSLAILEMLGEKGLEMFKHLGGMLSSGKQGDIAMATVTIAGLVAGGAGLTKFSLNLARKSAVKSARLAGREARIAGSTTSQATRTSLKIGAQKVGKVAEVADRIDDVVGGGAGIGHLTGAFGNKIKKAENHSGISRELVLENAKLSDTNRLKKASELLGKKLTPDQEKVILYIHEEISKGVYQNEYVDIRKMVEELDKVGISRKDGRKLMENGLLGELPDWLLDTEPKAAKILSKNVNEINDSYLNKLKEELELKKNQAISQLSSEVIELLPFLEEIGIKPEILTGVDINVLYKILNKDKSEKIKKCFYSISSAENLIILAGADISFLNTLLLLKNNGVSVNSYKLNSIKKLSLASIENIVNSGIIKKLKNEGIDISVEDIGIISKVDLNVIENVLELGIIKKLKNEGFSIYAKDIETIANPSNKIEIEKAIILKKAGFNVSLYEFDSGKIRNISQKDIDIFIGDHKRGEILRELKTLGIKFSIYEFSSLLTLPLSILEKVIYIEKQKLGISLGSPYEWTNFSKYSDEKMASIIALNQLGTFDDFFQPFNLSKLMMLDNSILQGISHISDIQVQRSMLQDLSLMIQSFPDFKYSGENTTQLLQESFGKYVTKNISEPVSDLPYIGDVKWKNYVDKMFRINDYEQPKIKIVGKNGNIIRKEGGFFMNQSIGDCYLIAPLNAMRNNQHFTNSLYKNLTYIKDSNPMNCKWGYHFPDGKYIEVSVREMNTLRIDGKTDSVKYLKNLNKTEMKKEIEEIAKGILRAGEKSDNGVVSKYGLELPKIDLSKYGKVDDIGVERFNIPQELIDQIAIDIEKQSGIYYEYALKKLADKKISKNVDASLGYKVLEALYSKHEFGSVDKLKLVGGFSDHVLKIFLHHKEWESAITYVTKDTIQRIIIEHALTNIDSENFIITCSVKNKIGTDENIKSYPYFSYNGNSLAEGHAYSIVGYDKINKVVKVVNPWENTKIIDVKHNDFFKVFDNVDIAKKIETSNATKVEGITVQTKININVLGLEMQKEIKKRLPLIKGISKSIFDNIEVLKKRYGLNDNAINKMRRSLEDYEYYINAITVEKDFSIVSFQQMQLAESSFDKVMKLSKTFSGIHGSNIDNLVNELRNHNSMIMMNNTRIESLFRNIN